jgi:ligand-binding sensor domain-containing protein
MQKVEGIIEGFTCGVVDQEGNLWFGTNTKGLFRYDGDSFTNFTEENGLSNNRVSSLLEDDKGNLWMGTMDGLCRFDLTADLESEKAFTHIAIPFDGNEDLWGPGLNAKNVISLIQDKRGDIWFGTWGAGAFRFTPSDLSGETEFTPFLTNEGRIQPDGLYKNVIQSITEDKDGYLWFTSMTHGGIARFDPSALAKKESLFTIFNLEKGLQDDMIFSSYQSKDGDLWFGSLGNREGGLHHYRQSKSLESKLEKVNHQLFENYNTTDGLCNNNIVNICEDNEGKLWLASGRGELCIFNRGEVSFSPFTSAEGKTYSGIRFVLEDDQNNIWFGGEYGQLYCYNGEQIIDFT